MNHLLTLRYRSANWQCLLAIVAVWPLSGLSRGQESPDVNELAAVIARLDAGVFSPAERASFQAQLARAARQKLATVNRASSQDWSSIQSRDDWEAYRRQKLTALRASLGSVPSRPRAPKNLVTAEISGAGFKIQNIVFESRPGLVVTANLYVPEPLEESMPGIVIAHSHHNPKEQGELQDMGMTWARAGCLVLVPDHLGHGERRQHPFVSAADFDGAFQLGRQDYYFRYDTSLQLYACGETLLGWLAHDLMTGVDFLLTRPGIDSRRIILLGAVAGGGDPAAVTAALDERIACVVPFNFGGPQPETRYPLPADAETSFNYAGGGSWESTRNLYRSAEEGFLPWVIVGSVAPRRVIHAHEFSWDQAQDPVWRRYQRIWSWYGAEENLNFAHGHGTLTSTDPPGSHCNNIGAVHRRQIHAALERWFNIRVRPEDEYSQRRKSEELQCLTEQAKRDFRPQSLHQILAAEADAQLAAASERLNRLRPELRRQALRQTWTEMLGASEPPERLVVRDGSPASEQVGHLHVRRQLLETEPGMFVSVLSLSLDEVDRRGPGGERAAILYLAHDGIRGALPRCNREISQWLKSGAVVALVEVRGIGSMGPGGDQGQQSTLTSVAASELMLGHALLGGQLTDVRAAWRHLRNQYGLAASHVTVIGDSNVEPLAANSSFVFPRRIDYRPAECDPTPGLLAVLLALFEDQVSAVTVRHGLISYRSLLASPFVQTPLDAVPPGVIAAGDIPAVIAALGDSRVTLKAPVDSMNRPVSEAAARQTYEPWFRAFGSAPANLRFEHN